MEKEYARVWYVDAKGEMQVADLDITGPTLEAERQLQWAVGIVTSDGGKVVDARFGTKQAGLFYERRPRHIPLIINGFRRMSAFLRA